MDAFPLDFHWPTYDPFLFCAYHRDLYPGGDAEMAPVSGVDDRALGEDFTLRNGFRMYHGETVPGFPAHPHRGFETITIVREGTVDHADSLGAAGRYGSGDVQWMTAGRGIQHSEMFPLLHSDQPNPTELFQVWLNLPGSAKAVEPAYKMMWREDIPEIREGGAVVRVIAGSYGDVQPIAPPGDSWASDPENQVGIWLVEMEKGGEVALPPSGSGALRTAYWFHGQSIEIDGERVSGGRQGLRLNATQACKLRCPEGSCGVLILQGRPIEEPVVARGPFVMNSQKEIIQAISDYHAGAFGEWKWPRADMVHPRSDGRFALFPDGSKITPS